MDDQFWYIQLLTNVKRLKDRVRRQACPGSVGGTYPTPSFNFSHKRQ